MKTEGTQLLESGFDPMVGIKKHNLQSVGYKIRNPRVVVEIEHNGVKRTIVKDLTVEEFLRAEWRNRPLAVQCVDEFKERINEPSEPEDF